MEFDPLAHARTRLLPLRHALTTLLEDEAQPEQMAFFVSIRDSIQHARVATDLADGLMQLSMSAFLGFRFSAPVSLLLDQLLMHAQELAEVLSLEEREIH
jgi:hypothetical protein